MSNVRRIPLGEGKPEIVVTEDGNDVIVDYPLKVEQYTINSLRLSPDSADELIEQIREAHSQSANDLILEAVEKAKSDS